MCLASGSACARNSRCTDLVERLFDSDMKAAKNDGWFGGSISCLDVPVTYELVLDSIHGAAIISALMEPELCKWRLYGIGAFDV